MIERRKHGRGWRESVAWILAAILLAASALRLWRLGESPPGLNVDEAANAWNAYCLLETGMDQHGVSWPILDSRGFGQGMTTVSLYALLPFQALFGQSIPTARMPAAVAGVATVLLLFWIGRRLFGSATGLIAAALLALLPWHLQVSRWGHMGSLFPLLSLIPFAALLWSGLLLDGTRAAGGSWDGRPTGPRRTLEAEPADRPGLADPSPLRALLAGAAAGLCAYGYFASRLYIPVLLAGLALAALPSWWRVARTTRGALAIGALAGGFLLTFGPLAFAYLTDPQIARRAAITWVWSESDSFGERILKVLSRYPGHFGPDFLFLHGDTDPAYSPPQGYGLFLWSTLPLLVAGLVAILVMARTSRAARVLLVASALYPVSDLFNEHPTLHSLRSLPGTWTLTLLAAVGAVAAWQWLNGRAPSPRGSQMPLAAAPATSTARGVPLRSGQTGLDPSAASSWVSQPPPDRPSRPDTAARRSGPPARPRALATAIALVWAALFLADTTLFLHRFFGAFNREPERVHVNHMDLLEACAWLRPRLDGFDAVYVTGAGMSHPYVYTLVALAYDPRRWREDTKEFVPGPLPNGAYNHEEICTRYGKLRFMIAESRQRAVDEVNDWMKSGRHAKLAFIVRPGELGLDKRARPALEIRSPSGEVTLSVFEMEI